jgi:hypothetical protein
MNRATATATKNQPYGEQDLLQVARGVEPRIQQTLQDHARRADHQEGEREREREGHAEARDRGGEDIAARHGEHPVREIGEAHQAHRDRQADRDDVEDHAERRAVKRDAHQRCEHSLHSGASRIRRR